MAVTYLQVQELIPDCDLSSAIISSIITDATNYITNALSGCTVMTAAETDAVIKWYSAHMVVSGPCRQVQREKLGEAEVEYDRQTGLDLTSTSFGRMALALDRCGKLKLAGKQAISITAVTSFE